MTPEAKIKKEIVAYLASIGAWYDNPVRNGYGRRGVPDIVCCYKGKFIAFEVKASVDMEPSPWQKREIEAIHAAGGMAVVVSSVEKVKGIIAYMNRMAQR